MDDIRKAITRATVPASIIGTIFGFIGDVLQPLIQIAPIIAGLSLLGTLVTLIWFVRDRRAQGHLVWDTLAGGLFIFCLASSVIFVTLSVVFAVGPERGYLASSNPDIAKFQAALLNLQQDVNVVKQTTQVTQQDVIVIATTQAHGFDDLQRSLATLLPVVTPTPAKMQRDFNIAIAEFVEEGSDGQFNVTENSRRLSQSVNDTLLAERDAFPDPQIKSAIEVRYGAMPITNGVVLIENDAAVVAERLGADMVIYGGLDRSGNFTPQFYVSLRVRAEIDALLTGNHRIGDQPIQFSPESSLNASTDLRTRASALFFIAAGLTYDVFGRADKSLELYRQAEQSLTDWPEIGAGKELLYFFKGQAALFRAQQLRQTNKSAAQDLTTEAEEAFRKAIGSNQNYARAYIGLGTAFYTHLQLAPAVSETFGSSEMQQMFDAYLKGQQLAQKGSERLVELVGTWSYGLGFYQQGRAFQARGDVRQAIESYQQAIALIQGTLDPLNQLDQPRVLAQAYLGLGAVYRELAALQSSQGDTPGSGSSTDGAKAALQQCIHLGQASQDRILKELIAGQRCQSLYDELIKKP